MISEMNYKVLLMPIAGLLLLNIIVSTATLTDGLLFFVQNFWQGEDERNTRTFG
jgi:hypothetical protein